MLTQQTSLESENQFERELNSYWSDTKMNIIPDSEAITRPILAT